MPDFPEAKEDISSNLNGNWDFIVVSDTGSLPAFSEEWSLWVAIKSNKTLEMKETNNS